MIRAVMDFFDRPLRRFEAPLVIFLLCNAVGVTVSSMEKNHAAMPMKTACADREMKWEHDGGWFPAPPDASTSDVTCVDDRGRRTSSPFTAAAETEGPHR